MPASCFGSQNPGFPTPPVEASRQGLGIAPNGQNQGFPDPHFGREKTRVWEEVKMVGLNAKMATSAPSPPFRLENWDLGQKRISPHSLRLVGPGQRQREWDEALEVQVSLAGDNTTCMRLTQSGTLLLPPLERAGSVQPIVPMGAVIEQLGYSLVWSAGSCKLHPPNGKPLRLRVKNGCPEVVGSQALTLISRLEEHKLEQVEELRRRTEHGKDRIRQAKLAMDKTWWDHLVDLARPTQVPGKWPCQQRRSFRRFPTKRCKAFSRHKVLMRNPFGTLSKGHSHTSTEGGGRHCISPRIRLSTCLPVPNPTNH